MKIEKISIVGNSGEKSFALRKISRSIDFSNESAADDEMLPDFFLETGERLDFREGKFKEVESGKEWKLAR